MWIIAKIKNKELSIFKKELLAKVGSEIKFYNPKIMCEKYFKNKIKKIDKYLLESYIFCYHKKFSEEKFADTIKFIRGLQYILGGFKNSQLEITKFIEKCKSFENKNGYLLPNFFSSIIKNKGRFTSGPFTNVIFDIIEKSHNKLKIQMGNIKTTISSNSQFSYQSV